MLAFQSRLGNTQKISKVIVASWVEKMFFYREKLLINNLQEIMQKGSFSTTIINEFKEKINEYELMIINKNNKIASFFKKEVDSLRVYDYWDYYIYMLPIKIEEKLALKEVQSLLPQEIVQQIIEEDFECIPV